eukprot:Awhi_evm1s9721
MYRHQTLLPKLGTAMVAFPESEHQRATCDSAYEYLKMLKFEEFLIKDAILRNAGLMLTPKNREIVGLTTNSLARLLVNSFFILDINH